MRVGFNLEDDSAQLQMQRNLIAKTGDWKSPVGQPETEE